MEIFTVPGNPALGFEDPAMEMAAKTWKAQIEIWRRWNVWNSIVYDSEFNNIYLGVGNGSPWTREIRSPGGAIIYSYHLSLPWMPTRVFINGTTKLLLKMVGIMQPNGMALADMEWMEK